MFAIFRIKDASGISQHTGPSFASRDLNYCNHRSYHSTLTGDIWATMVLEDTGEQLSWYPLRKNASGEQPWHSGDRPGTLLTNMADIFILPYELLVREFHLTYKDYDNAQQERTTQEQQAKRGEEGAAYQENSLDRAASQQEEEASMGALLAIKGIESPFL